MSTPSDLRGRLLGMGLLLLPGMLRAQAPAATTAAVTVACAVEAPVRCLVVVDGWVDIPPALPGDSLGALPLLLSRQVCATRYRQSVTLRLRLDEGGHVTRVAFEPLRGLHLPDPALNQQLAAVAKPLRFWPAFRRGQPAPCRLLVQVWAFPEDELYPAGR